MHFIKDYLNIIRLMFTKYFDKNHYKLENPGLKGNLYKHYYYIGYKEGKNPSEYFDNDYYLMKHKDVKDANINPLIHYLKKGKKEKRKIKKVSEISLDRLYYKLYNEIYNINIHLVNDEKKVNFIINKLDKKSLNIISEINKKYSFDRLFYFDGDKELLNELGKSIICEKVYKDYYLNIGINDLNICFDEHSLKTFNNNGYINNLYIYIDKIDCYDKEFINYISYYTKIGKIKILSSNKLKINAPLFFDISFLDRDKEFKFVFKDNLFLGFDLLNNYFLKNNFDICKKIYYETDKLYYTVQLENKINLFYNKDDFNKFNIIIFDSDSVYFENGNLIINFKSDDYLKSLKLEQVLNESKKIRR